MTRAGVSDSLCRVGIQSCSVLERGIDFYVVLKVVSVEGEEVVQKREADVSY